MNKGGLIKRLLLTALAMICILGATFPAASAQPAIRVFVEGSLVTARDTQGRLVQPQVIGGTTFLPFRAIGEAFGRDVSWDGATQSVFIGTRPANVPPRGSNIRVFIDGTQITPRDAQGQAVHPFIQDGTTFLPVRAVGDAFGKDIYWDARNQSVFVGRGTFTITAGGSTHTATMADILALSPRAVTQPHRGELRHFRGVPLAAVFSRLGVNHSGAALVTLNSEDGFSTAITIAEALDRSNAFIVIEDGNGRPLGTIDTEGRGPFMNVVSQDQFANRSARHLTEIVLS